MTDPGRSYEGVILAGGTVHIADMDLLTTLCSGAQALGGTGTGLARATCSRCIMLHRDRCAHLAVAMGDPRGRNPPGIPPGSREHPGGPLPLLRRIATTAPALGGFPEHIMSQAEH